MIKVLVIGCHGKMGKITLEAIRQTDNFQLAGLCGALDDLGKVITDNQPDVGVDFTTPGTVFNNAKVLIEHGVRPLIGTSGLMDDQINILKQLCVTKGLGGMIVPNFSIGAILMMQCADLVAKYFPDASIIETHHPDKQDAPSATAIATAEGIARARTKSVRGHASVELLESSLGALYKGINIHSVRLPGKVAHQSVTFGGIGETLTIKHDTNDRTAFIQGIILAIHQVMEVTTMQQGLDT